MDAKAAAILHDGRAHLVALVPAARGDAGLVGRRHRDGRSAIYAEEPGAKLGQVAQPLRAALTGRSVSPGVFDVLEVLGRDESLGGCATRPDGELDEPMLDRIRILS